jgi:uncharacterized protein (TIGR02145 family)
MLLKNTIKIIAAFVLAIVLAHCTSADIEPLPPPPIEDTPSSSSSAPPEPTPNIPIAPDSFTDTRDGQEYKTVEIGGQTWMAKNLNFNDGSSMCYDNEPTNCATYGRLYDWAMAMYLPASCNSNSCASQISTKHKGVCPTGWHLPTQAEWNELSNSVGGSDVGGRHLKATSGWNNNGNGLDIYGFAALPGGNGSSDGSFFNVGYTGLWWSSTEYARGEAYYGYMYYSSEDARWLNYDKISLFSVRCVQN